MFQVTRLQSCCCTASLRNLLIKEVDDDEIKTVINEPTGSTTDFHDDVRIFSIQLSLVRCSHIVVRDENGRLVCSTPILHIRRRIIM